MANSISRMSNGALARSIVPSISEPADLAGFSAIALWGDSGAGRAQTLWVDDVAVTPGGPVKSVPQPRPTAPRVVGPNP